MFTDIAIIKVEHGDAKPMRFKRLVTDAGEVINDCYLNDCALPIPGYIPVKRKTDDKETLYINADKLLLIIVDDDQQDNMRTDIIKPKEYKEKG